MPLSELEKREIDILKQEEESKAKRVKSKANRPLSHVFGAVDDEDDDYDSSCIICYL